jgi:hypothetical protein
MNLVLGDSEEFRKLPPKKGIPEDEVSAVVMHREGGEVTLGLVAARDGVHCLRHWRHMLLSSCYR